MSDEWRILVVDDDRLMARTLVDILRIKGYQAEARSSATEAVDMAKKGHSVGCIVADIRMPAMNGVELVRAIRTIRPDLPMLLMTAVSDDGLAVEGLQAGAKAVLPKPLDINVLLTCLPGLRPKAMRLLL